MPSEQIIKYDPVKGYKILNVIQPKYFQTAFPYNAWNQNKLIFTQNKIELLISKAEKLRDVDSDGNATKSPKKKSSEKLKSKSTKKGGGENAEIIIYG
jgi:hypothetical protein